MLAGAAKIDITPSCSVWMDGMPRAHPSEGIHDPLFARVLVLANSEDRAEAFAIVSVDVCVLSSEQTHAAGAAAECQTGIPVTQIMIAATHTHSGPATLGLYNPQEAKYAEELSEKIVVAIDEAAGNMQPAAVGAGSGCEDTISHYRRLLADDGRVIMNWEPFPTERIVGPLGQIDPEVAVFKAVPVENPDTVVAILFSHAGHPNVLSGDNYLLSADYPGVATRLLEEQFGGTALFVNGAQGTMDIDGLRHRDWEGMERAGRALAAAVAGTAQDITVSDAATIHGSSARYHIPARKISDEELSWAEKILERTGGQFEALADGVGDDYKAKLYRDLRESQDKDIQVEQLCFAIDRTALLSFPGELFTEIGVEIKKQSPFEHTCIVGVTNGYIRYVPTAKAISEGGYAVDTRCIDAQAEEIVVEQSLALLERLYNSPQGGRQ